MQMYVLDWDGIDAAVAELIDENWNIQFNSNIIQGQTIDHLDTSSSIENEQDTLLLFHVLQVLQQP